MSFTTNISDDEIIDSLEKQLRKMCVSRKLPIMSIPAKPNEDFDLLLAELLIRFMKKDEEVVDLSKYIIDNAKKSDVYCCNGIAFRNKHDEDCVVGKAVKIIEGLNDNKKPIKKSL